MQVHRDTASIVDAIRTSTDDQLRQLLTLRVEYLGDEDELLKVVTVEPGDTLQAVDAELGASLLSNPYAGKRFGDAGFVPTFETLEEYAGFYEAFFIQGDIGTAVIVPKRDDIDPQVRQLFALHATPAPELLP